MAEEPAQRARLRRSTWRRLRRPTTGIEFEPIYECTGSQELGYKMKPAAAARTTRSPVPESLGFGENWKGRHPSFPWQDVIAAREVASYGRQLGSRMEGELRTTVRGVLHDTVPTGPPARTPPHNLKGESAAWVDEKLEEEVRRGQLGVREQPL